ncbi:MAG: alanine dehydrogenase [Pseudomonadota bacterium]
MRIGVPKEIKTREYRVGLTPDAVTELVATTDAEVLVETGAGAGIDLSDEDYAAAGATIAADAAEVFERSDMIVKVKEPQLPECAMLREGQILFTYLHLAADKPQTEALMKSGATAIAYETVTSPTGGLPLLQPMSQVAGRMSVQVGAHSLEKAQGGRGLLLGGVPGVGPAKVVILGGGVAGVNALQMALGLRGDVTLFEKSPARLSELDALYGEKASMIYSTKAALADAVANADLVIGAVLIPGAAAPKLVTRDMLSTMKRGAVLVDISIDQGGCFETSKPTTHDDPIYEVDGVVHYCVANMPGGVPRTSTFALGAATLPYVKSLARKGVKEALAEDRHFAAGLNISDGKVRHEAVAEALDLAYAPL